MDERKVNFLSKYPFSVIAAAITWYILLFKGFRKFFIEFGVAPAGTIAELIGALIVPVTISYLLARLFARGNKDKVFRFWISGLSIILIIMTIGKFNGEYRWW
jgi:hypothetical protein